MNAQVITLPEFSLISISYTLYPKTKRLTDVANVCAVHDKFFCDALVEGGKLPDDSYIYLPTVTYSIGSVDKSDPRVEILIQELGDIT